MSGQKQLCVQSRSHERLVHVHMEQAFLTKQFTAHEGTFRASHWEIFLLVAQPSIVCSSAGQQKKNLLIDAVNLNSGSNVSFNLSATNSVLGHSGAFEPYCVQIRGASLRWLYSNKVMLIRTPLNWGVTQMFCKTENIYI